MGVNTASLAPRLRLGALVHPRQAAEPRIHRGDDVLDEVVGLGLRLGGEILGDIELAHRLAERVGRRVDAALPPLLVDRRAVEDGALEREVGVDEFRRQQRGPAVEGVEGKVRLPRRQRLAGDQLGGPGDGARRADDHARLAGDAGGGQERRPRQAGEVARQIGGRCGIIRLVDLTPLDPAPLDRGEFRLEVIDLLRPRFRVGDAGEGEQLGDVRPVLHARLGELRVLGIEIIVAVGQAEAALAEIDAIDVGVLEILAETDGDRRLDPVTIGGPEQRGERGAVGQPMDRRQLRPDRLEPLRLDRGRVYEAGVVIADLPHLAARRGVGRRRRLDQTARPRLAEVAEQREHAVRRAVVGDDPASPRRCRWRSGRNRSPA